MLSHDTSLRCVAVSYDTTVFADLKHFMKSTDNVDLERMDPEDFFVADILPDQYINLVTKSLDQRKQISQSLDNWQAKRFSYIHPSVCYNSKNFAKGVFLYPSTVFYPGSEIGNDVIVHSCSVLAHNSKYGRGTVVSGHVSTSGSVNIGEFCFLGVSATIYDNVNICDNVTLGANAVVRKSINEPGTYYTKSNLKKLVYIGNTAGRSR